MKRHIVSTVLALFVALPVFADPSVQDESVLTETEITADTLRNMSQPELNALYHDALPGTIPDGSSDGTAVFFPNSLLNAPTMLLASLIWQGKIFDADDGVLVNRVFGFRAIQAAVYDGVSLYDGRESIIVDYSETSLLARQVRDEIREVAPGLYLGRAYLRTWIGDYFVLNFILDFN
jgi:hypothetical protein